MTDFFDDVDDRPQRWLSFYGELGHDRHDCPRLQDAKTLRRARSSRPACPDCVWSER